VPRTYDLSGVPVRVLFAPDHTPELEIMKQLLKGSKECYFAIFTFAGSSGIDDAMLALARGGMTLKGALDPGQAAQDWAAPKWLKHKNIELYVPKRAGAFAKLRKLHHKLMVIDERIVVAGSFNYTQPANEYNDENIFVMGSTHAEVEGVEVEANASRQLAVYLKQEIQRIISLSKPYDPS
jgi:phosphatidylserine/phosphatidylglycerophosphate/cardiolipin synthase-like enzyme